VRHPGSTGDFEISLRNSLMTAFRLLHDLFENVLHGETGSQEWNSITMHQLQQVSAGAIDTGNVLEIDRDGAARLYGLRLSPAVFEFGDKGAGQSALHS
jgi:hypothetical protein